MLLSLVQYLLAGQAPIAITVFLLIAGAFTHYLFIRQNGARGLELDAIAIPLPPLPPSSSSSPLTPSPSQPLSPSSLPPLPPPPPLSKNTSPISVNYHFTRKCNYSCGFCFHTATSSYVADINDAKQALRLLRDAGMRKMNFAGGEPFLYPPLLGQLVDYCKAELGLESVSIVSNGSKITEDWMKEHSKNLDILAVSCDSFDEKTNAKIGRGTGHQVKHLERVAGWCREYNVMFKMNTVVNKFNFEEDMNAHIERLSPTRWKCFQVLKVEGENDSAKRKKDVTKFLISDEEFKVFCDKHNGQKAMVPESNKVMAKSYLILDERLRFLDREGRKPSGSVIEVGVQEALNSVFWDEESFKKRGGVFDWTKGEDGKPACGGKGSNKELEW
ncbi:MAG: hypothetical protein Q9227_004104 [Pyrenula ochraceoflavens]